jgi:hypothetical protein
MKLQHYDDELPLIWLVDFFLLAHSPRIDWRELHEACERFRWGGALASVQLEVERRLGLPLPRELGPSAPAPRATAVKRGAARGWNELLTLNSRGRVLLVKAWFFPDPAYLRWKYQPRWSWTWPFYYPVRWAQSVLSGLGFLLRRIGGEKTSRPALVQSRRAS